MPGKYSPVISPLLEIRSEPGSVDLSGIQAILFTSRNAVREFARRSEERHVPALCVGDATAKEASALGLSASSAGGDVAALAALAAASYLPELGAFLHLRGGDTAGDLAGSLMAEGIPAEERIIYDQFPLHLSGDAVRHMDAGQQAVATVFSPRSGNLLADEIPAHIARKTRIVAISENAAAPFRGVTLLGLNVAQVPKAQAILQILAAI